MIQELCLIPKSIVDKLQFSNVNIIDKKTKMMTNSESGSSADLHNLIKLEFKSKVKYKKALELYEWILQNVKEFKATSTGDVIAPLSNFNIIQFMKDIFSGVTHFSKDSLNLYKVWVSMVNLPVQFIDNKTIKNNLYANISSDIKPSLKREFPWPEQTTNEMKKFRSNIVNYDTDGTDNVSTNTDDDDNNIVTSPNSPISPISPMNKSEAYIDRKFEEFASPSRPRLRSQSKKKKNLTNLHIPRKWVLESY